MEGLMSSDWLKTFESIGMIWKHDGNPRRPYARLTSGKISDGFVNCSHLISRPALLHKAANDLIGKYWRPEMPLVVLGQAMGSITIADHVAHILGARLCWTIKTETGMQLDPRFTLDKNIPILPVEDVTTTGGTTQGSIQPLQRRDFMFTPFFFTLVNRSGKIDIDGFKIRSLVNLDIATWEWGNNPHTPNGLELIEAVRPKENWDALTKAY